MSEWQDYITRARAGTIDAIAGSLRLLLEQKHLYQSVTFTLEGAIPIVKTDQRGDPLTAGLNHIRALAARTWFLADPLSNKSVAAEHWLTVRSPDLKLYCHTCRRIEAFNLVSVEDFFDREAFLGILAETTQAFVFSYRCQSCKGVPEVFLVRRQGFKLTNSGRTPLEHVDVPSVIPKSVGRFYSGAIIAHQSGQILAGLFLLRTLIEQFARAYTTSEGLADEVLVAYMATLPAGFSDRFPSLRKLYGELSADIHNATGSAELFETARAELVEHFDARRLFKIVNDAVPT